MNLDSISIRQLSKHASTVIAELEHGGKPVLVTRAGTPVAVITPLVDAPDAPDSDREDGGQLRGQA